MGEACGKIDLEKLILYSDDLVGFLKDKKDLNNLERSLQHSKALRSSCDADFNEVQNLLQGLLIHLSSVCFSRFLDPEFSVSSLYISNLK